MKVAFMAAMLLLPLSADAQTASARADAARMQDHISLCMYAAFVETMAEDVK